MGSILSRAFAKPPSCAHASLLSCLKHGCWAAALPAVEDVLDRVFRIKDPSFAGIAPRKTSVQKEAHDEEE